MAALGQHARELRRNSTDAERILWRELRAHRFAGCKFKRQQPLGRYIVDFVCLGRRIVIEVDGGQHAEAVSEDRERDRWLNEQGFCVLRFWNNEVISNLEGVLVRVSEAVDAPSPPAPLPSMERGE
jgi:very-short-patch-repair endonuclease